MKSKFLRSALVTTSAALLAVAGAVSLAMSPAYADTSTPESSTGAKESGGQMVDDAAITTKVKSAFVQDEKVSAMRISVTTNKGIVQLSGFANSAQEADRAAEVARQVSGVKEVQNNIELKGSQQSPSPKSQY